MKREESTGRLYLRFAKNAKKTVLATQYYKLPLQLMTPYYHDGDGTAFMYLLNPSGGVMQNDRLLTEIVVEEKARAVITTPSANKYYRMENGGAVVWNDCTVGRGAVLEYLPGHNIPFASSQTLQVNHFHLAEDSVLMATDMTTPGRVARDESFLYDYFHSKTSIYVDGKLELFDHVKMEPKRDAFAAMGVLEGYTTNAAVYVYSPRLSPAIEAQMQAFLKRQPEVCAGITMPSPRLAVVRFLGQRALPVQTAVEKTWAELRLLLLEKKAVRFRR